MKTSRVSTPQKNTSQLAISQYLPYRFALISRRLSKALEEAYKQQHALSRTEWRTLALLHERQKTTASDLVALSGMDAVAVHRAVKSLETRGLVKREVLPDDKRAKFLGLTIQGRKIFSKVAPHALALQDDLLGHLNAQEAKNLAVALEKLMQVEFSAQLC